MFVHFLWPSYSEALSSGWCIDPCARLFDKIFDPTEGSSFSPFSARSNMTFWIHLLDRF